MVEHWSIRSITRTLLPILFGLTVLELIGGLTLGSFEMILLQYPTLLVLVPVMIGTAGNLGSILSAKMSTAFHLGVLSFEPTDENLLGHTLTTVVLAVSVFPVVGVGGWLITTITGVSQLPVGTIVSVALATGLVLAVLAIIVTLMTTYAAYRFGLDPDDVVIPVVTNVCDVLGVLVFIGVVHVIVV